MRWPAGDGPTDYQQEIIARLPESRRIAVRGPHGLGKTALASWLVLWFALSRDAAGVDWKIVTTASAWRQLTHFLWPEVRKWARRLRWNRLGREAFNARSELLQLQLRLTSGEAFAVASDSPELIEGAHADSLLYVFDEAKVIPPGMFDAAEGAFSGAGRDTAVEAFAVAISTPGAPAGRFYEIHKRAPGYEDWWTRHVRLEETIAAGRVSREWADQRALQWGESSAVYQNRVLGEFAAGDEDGIIPLAWVEMANERWHRWMDGGDLGALDRLGVDVGTTGDRTVFAFRHGNGIRELRYLPKEDPKTATMATAGRIKGILDANPGATASVDAIGIGAGIVHRLAELECWVEGFNAANRTDMRDRSGELGFANLRAAAWWNLREMLDPSSGEGVALPPDDILTGDLTAPRYSVQSGGRIRVEAKDEIRKRLGRSTDAGDAVVEAYWTEAEAPVWEML